MSFLKPKTPTAPTAAIVPTTATPAVQAASEAARRRERTASGRAATMLTNQESYTSPNIGTTKLLGG